MRFLRPKHSDGEFIVILLATNAEIEVLIEALDANRFSKSESDDARYGNLRVDLVQARYGKLANAKR